jgi:hypothetical protein
VIDDYPRFICLIFPVMFSIIDRSHTISKPICKLFLWRSVVSRAKYDGYDGYDGYDVKIAKLFGTFAILTRHAMYLI